MGADRAILVGAEDAALDADAVARILKAVVEREKPDLVVLGKQAVDGDSNQVGQLLAGLSAGRRRRSSRASARPPTARAPTVRARSTPASRRSACACRPWSRSTCASSARRPCATTRSRPRRRVGGDAALRVAQGHHGGEEEADRGDHARRARRHGGAAVKVKTYEAPPAARPASRSPRSRSSCRSSTTKRR